MRRTAIKLMASACGTALLAGLTVAVPAASLAAGSPLDDGFYHYHGSRPLAEIKPGTVLATRTVDYSIQGLALPLEAVQLLYRTTNQVGRATANVTTVVRPLVPLSSKPQVVTYESFYDSLNPADEPSAVIAGGGGMGAGIANVETGLFAPLLLAGYTIVIPDTEGQRADFAAGPEYGVNTLDALKASSHSTKAGIGTHSPIGLIGYSGGAIGAEWAAELAAEKAPGIARRIVGTAVGGVLVKPSTNLHYIDGSSTWAGVMAMALVGISRSFHVDLRPYASKRGVAIMKSMRRATISEVLGAYPGLTWAQLAKKRYRIPESLPVYVRLSNHLIMGTGGTPTAPMFIGQGNGGTLEGTPVGPAGIGPGDGVMVAGDVRALARKYCREGVRVQYQEYPLSHFTTVTEWMPAAASWLVDRFSGSQAPSSCGSIAKGNSIKPIHVAGKH
jgi:Secretory lipase